jgi:hypothetical protein
MGGGEVVRYLSRYGSDRVAKAVLLGSVTPYMLKTPDNPDGVDQSLFDEILANINDDRPAFLESFALQFYGVSMLKHPVSQALLDWNQMLALAHSHPRLRQFLRPYRLPGRHGAGAGAHPHHSRRPRPGGAH